MAELSHSVISPMSFRVEYKRNGTGPVMFQRHVRFQVCSLLMNFTYPICLLLHFFVIITHSKFQVDISAICKQGDVADMLFAITFTLLSGMHKFDYNNLFLPLTYVYRKYKKI